MLLYTDGASRGNPGPAGIGVVLQDENGDPLEKISLSIGEATNNQAEYRALCLGIERALARGATTLRIRLDSELVVKQVKGIYAVKNFELRDLHTSVLALLRKLMSYQIEYVPREQNAEANRLAQRASGNIKN